MEVTDPNTGVPVMVRMRRDLPGYNVTRARRSPRLRWSLPVDIQWQSECVMKFLGQKCACCDSLDKNIQKDKPSDDSKLESSASNMAAKPPVPRPGGIGGHDTVFVDSKMKSSHISGGTGSKTEMNKNIIEEKSFVEETVMTSHVKGDVRDRLSLDAFPGFPLPTSNGERRSRRRKQLISTSDMLVAKPQIKEELDGKKLSPFDVMQANLGLNTEYSDVTIQQEMMSQTPLGDIIEEETAETIVETKETS